MQGLVLMGPVCLPPAPSTPHAQRTQQPSTALCRLNTAHQLQLLQRLLQQATCMQLGAQGS
jgi:hypothetical protein